MSLKKEKSKYTTSKNENGKKNRRERKKNGLTNLPLLCLLLQTAMVGTRVYVGGLSYRVGERDLDRFFRSYGRLRDIVIKNGFGFVVS